MTTKYRDVIRQTAFDLGPTGPHSSQITVAASKRRPARPAVIRPMAPRPERPAAKVAAEPRKPIKIPVEALAQLLAGGRNRRPVALPSPAEMWRVAQPPPGVIPEGHKLAMDSAIESFAPTLAWGLQNNFVGAFQEGTTFLGYPYLAQLAQRPEYRKIVETIATEATRKWIKFTTASTEGIDRADPARLKLIEEWFDQMRVRDHAREILEQDGFFGRAHLFIDMGDIDKPEELRTPIGNGENGISKGKVGPRRPVQRLKTVEPVWCYPSAYNANNPLDPRWFNPEMWFVQGREVHVSRLMPFIGREVPDLLKPVYSFGGLSMTQMAKPYVDNWLATRQAVADILMNFSVRGVKTDLAALMSGDGAELVRKVAFFTAAANNQGMLLLDKANDDYFQTAAPLSSLDLLQAQAQEHLSSVSGIPLVKLLGIQPAGLNASSEGELIVFEDLIHAYQEKILRHPLTKLLHFAQLSIDGKIDKGIGFIFNPLREMSEKERAEIRKMNAETDDILVNGVAAVSPEEVRIRIAADPEMPYGALDPTDVPEPPEDPEIDKTGEEPFGGKTDDGEEPDAEGEKIEKTAQDPAARTSAGEGRRASKKAG